MASSKVLSSQHGFKSPIENATSYNKVLSRFAESGCMDIKLADDIKKR
jgi:hypothetical protein